MSLSLADVPRLQYMVLDRFPELADHHILSLVQLIQAAADDVERHAGGPTATETFLHERRLPGIIALIRPIAGITSITERRTLADAAVALDATDYRQLDAWRILRLSDGVNPSSCLGQEVTISYDAAIDQAVRDRVICELVALSAKWSAHERSQEVIGDYSIAVTDDHQARRAEILAQLTEGRALVF
jgi:hypothetical protein